MFRFRRCAAVERDLTLEAESSEGVEALDTLKRSEHQDKYDPNLPADEIELVDAAVNSSDAEKGVKVEVALLENDSPYPEVYPLLLI